MTKFVRLNERDRIKLFLEAKKKNKDSWNLLYSELNISRSMLFKYLSGEYSIPEKIFLKLESIGKVKIFNKIFIYKEKYLEKEIPTLLMSNSLAEIIGVINGDGHMNTLTYEICITGNIFEKEYFYYLKTLFDKNLNLSFKIYEQDGKIRLKAYSKKLIEILSKSFGLPVGNKIGKLRVPRIIFKKEIWTRFYIKGLFDTDGSFYTRRKNEPVLNISSADSKFLQEILKMLNSLEFKASLAEKNIYLYNKDEIGKFFKLIKPANSKHLKKYNQYLNQAPLVYR